MADDPCSPGFMERLLSERARNSTSSAIRDLLRLTAQPHILSMAGGLPAAELFPVAGLRAIADEILGEPRSAEAALQYGPIADSVPSEPQGSLSHRQIMQLGANIKFQV